MLNFTNPFYEVAVVGENALGKIAALNQSYIPNKLIVGSKSSNIFANEIYNLHLQALRLINWFA